MSERRFIGYVEGISSNVVTLEAPTNHRRTDGGIGIVQLAVTTNESTPEAGFWGTAASDCGVFFEVIIRRV